MRYTTGLVMLLIAFGVLAWALRHRRRVLAVVSKDALARYMDKQSDDPHSISAFGEIMRPIVLFALVWIGAKSVAAYFWMDGPKYLSLFDLGSLLALLASSGDYRTDGGPCSGRHRCAAESRSLKPGPAIRLQARRSRYPSRSAGRRLSLPRRCSE